METKNNEVTEIKNDEVLEKNVDVKVNEEEQEKSEFLPYNPEQRKDSNDVLVVFGVLVLIFSIIIILSVIIFGLTNKNNNKIFSGVYIKNIDVSNLTKEEAYEKLEKSINDSLPEEVKFRHLDYETSIAIEELNVKFDIENAVNLAYNIGREGKTFERNLNVLLLKITKLNIEPDFTIDEEQLKKNLEDISLNLPDKVIESGYYIDGNSLIVTKGKTGNVVAIDNMVGIIKNKIYNLTLKDNVLEIQTIRQEPNKVDIEKIHNEIYKEAKNAYYTQNPYSVFPSENGLDFKITVDEAKTMFKSEDKDEYTIPLKVIYPSVTTNMIGTEAFPDLLSTFSTKYAVSNKNRTTNLVLASNKINGAVVMPGEIFSYNTVVGERTIAAGYKEAAIYLNGEVVDGLGGGICQITTTLYNAVVYANLGIVERRNHQFVPSYAGASRDATVVYGSTDFKFKNTREYPIKIVCSVNNGIATFQIFGMKTNNEYEVQVVSRITSSTANSINSEAYKILKQNGQVVSTELLSKDVYKKH